MRHVFVLIDGTNCVLATETNIQKIHALSGNGGYARCYQAGIGALTRTKLTDNLLAPNLEPRALEIFQTLEALELKQEDRLYIFGYSRGAVIARVLSMCIASSEHLLSAARMSGFTASIQAQIEFLCLFDPVAGRPRLHSSSVPNHDAILEPKIKNYLELLSAEESRPHFPSDSYSASKAVRNKLASISSVSTADSTADRQAAMVELGILKTRKAIWFPGTHADVGGHGNDSAVGLNALVATLKEFEYISRSSNLGVSFPSEDVQSLIDAADNIAPQSPPAKGWARRALSSFSRRISRRKPKPHDLVQHYGHPMCANYAGARVVLDEFPEYPV